MVVGSGQGGREQGGREQGGREPDGEEPDAVLFDAADLDTDDTDWAAGVDYTRAMRAAVRGARAAWRVLEGVAPRGSRVRVKAWCTREGEPMARADLRAGGWAALDARIRDLEERAADGDRYRALVAMMERAPDADGVARVVRQMWCPAVTGGV
jgi:hypothetical protein